MNIDLVVVGRTNVSFVEEGMKEYVKRLTRYVKFSVATVPDIRGGGSLSEAELRRREGEALTAALEPYDRIVLLDEHGTERSSEELASWLEEAMNRSVRRLAFVVGGAYGFSEQVRALTGERLSVSRMTFSHQMIRLLFTEQLYRAFTIIRKEPYHHR
ncbi:MAG: 23S rRNA (pseudouridine(1915)-N(3))-methyltransferase RlmH [Rikenellaceae bacterium]|nr:23S rRNA (pseudouridine(1915)-N(3))-methyltransferase RlmH [Rikenellaceae bacterium]